MMHYRDFYPDDDDDYVNPKENWKCILCSTYNWTTRKYCRGKDCNAQKRLFEQISNEDWAKQKHWYNSWIYNTSMWKFSKLPNKEVSEDTGSTIYDKISICQQNLYLKWAKKDANLVYTTELYTVPPSAISYVEGLMNGSTSSKNNIKEETLQEFVKHLWINHEALFMMSVRAKDKGDIPKMLEHVKKIDPYEKAHYTGYNGVSYDESYNKVTSIIMKQFDNPELCREVRERIIKKYSRYCENSMYMESLKYPVEIKRYTGYIEDPFFDARSGYRSRYDRDVKAVANDRLQLWEFILSNYVYDRVELRVEVIDSRHVRFCWAWLDHSW
jgi:hypothetical protein